MDFFKNKAYKRFFDELEKKYKRTGKITGFINIEALTEVEVRALEEIGQYFHRETGKDIKIKVSKLNTYFENTILPVNNCEELLFWYKGNIETNKEKRSVKEKDEEDFVKEILEKAGNSKGERFLREFLNTEKYRKLFILRYNQNKENLKNDLIYLGKTLDILPVNKSLTMLSNEITGDPHYFDEKNSFFVLLMEGIKFILEAEEELNTLSGKYELLNKAGLYREDMLNNIAIYNFHGTKSDDEKSYLMEGAVKEKTHLILSIGQINNLKEIKGLGEHIIILENPSTFHSSIDNFEEYSFICTSGNLNMAAYTLLDKLVVEERQGVYYIGDLDPEGLVIADRLKEKYGFIKILGTDKKLYTKYLSGKELSEISLKKLDKLKNIDKNLVEEIKKQKKAAFQESYTEELIKQIKIRNN